LLRKKKQHIRISVLETKLWDNFEESESEEWIMLGKLDMIGLQKK
jgi:hypothetical protein